MSKFSRIFVHCSGTDWGSAIEIDDWHKARGWHKIGYNFVIGNGVITQTQETPWGSMVGSLEAGRAIDDDSDVDIEEVGAHTFGFNYEIGICLIGEHNFSELQLTRLRYLVAELQRKLDLPPENVFGHYEAGELNPKYATTKTCPNIPMHDFRSFIKDKISLHELMTRTRAHNDALKAVKAY